MDRSAAEVYDDHPARVDCGDVEGGIAADFAPDCVLPTTYGRFDAYEGVRAAKTLLATGAREEALLFERFYSQHGTRKDSERLPFLNGRQLATASWSAAVPTAS